jgi:hypothetical protein
MTQEFDPKKSYLLVKANEKMIAYASFALNFDEDRQRKEGVMKISSSKRPYGGGYFTLTFIVDTSDDESLKAKLAQRFNVLTEDFLRSYLGQDMEKIVKVSLDSLEQIPEWYIEEVSIHFRKTEDRVNVLIEDRLVPALASGLSFSFDPVEWWPADKPVQGPEETSMQEHTSLKTIFRKWFKGQ